MMALVIESVVLLQIADNYDELATVSDDGSCIPLGCMSEWADNYDELATTVIVHVIVKVVWIYGLIIMMN